MFYDLPDVAGCGVMVVMAVVVMVILAVMVAVVMMVILLVMVGMVMLLLPVYSHRHMRPCNAAGGALYRLQVHAGQASPFIFSRNPSLSSKSS